MQLCKSFAFPLALALALFVTSGCSNQPREKTAAEKGDERWRMARAGVLYSLAKEQYETGNLDDSRKTITNASKYAPDHVLIRLLSAKLSIEQGQLEAADAELNRVRELDPKNAEADYLTGVINQRWQKPEVAYQAYQRAGEKNPNELAYLLAQAEMLVQMEQSQKALEILRGKLSFFENSPAIRDAVGQLLVQDGQHAEAATILRQASALAPDEQTIREHYGMALFYNKQYREAVSVLERLINAKDDGKGRPSYANRADLRTAIGECQMEIDQPRDARDNFELASQLQPENVTVWLNLAKVALRLNDLKRAELSLKKAMTIEPKSADAHVLMGYLYLQQSKLSEALASFRKASTLDQRDAVSLCMSGFVLEKMGRSDEAIRYYSQALRIKPNDELATSLLAKVQVQE
ncbi:MAG TPA: tetratricopeptide repeat protein [Tepidisphaeraceae bacterium]|jgi:tetratricopeptide (TPR) repeat protein|nr:tetratricopeptide repeat protein [Tepidisphaeraceae bacterium]